MTTKNLAATITIGGTMTAGLKGALGSATKALKDIGSEIGKVKDRQKQLNEVVKQAERRGKLGNAAGYAISELREVESRLGRIRAAQSRLNDSIKTSEKLNATAGKMRSVGAGMTVAGGGMIASLVPGVQEAKRMQVQTARIEALGFSGHDTKDLMDAAKSQKAFGVSTVHATETARDLASAFGDVHHAIEALPLALKQRAALKLYDEGHGTDLAAAAAYSMAKVIELRNGTKSPEEYARQANMSHQVLVATGGRVNGESLQEAIKRGGIAMKGMTNEAFYYGGSHFMQEMGGDGFGTASMSLYQALGQGRLTKRAANNLEDMGLIGDKSKVSSDKAGQVKFMDPGALLGYQTFARDPQKWVEDYFIPALKKKGIDPDDMQKVSEVAGMIISNRTGANLLATRVAQRQVVAKEAANAARADDIDKGVERVKGSTGGAEMDAEAKYMDAKKQLGETILPTYTKAMLAASDALKSFNEFAEKHGTLVSVMVGGIAALGAGLVILGPIMTVAGGLLTAYAAVQLRAAAQATATAAAMNVETAAITAQGAAASTAGGKIAGFLKGRLAVLALANVADYAAGKMGVGQGAIDQNQDDTNWAHANTWDKATSAPLRGIEHVGRFLGMSNFANQAQSDRIAKETQYLREHGRMPEAPKAGTAPAAPAAPQTFNFNLTQQPGESQDALAKRIMDQIKRQQGVQQRGSLTDGATAN